MNPDKARKYFPHITEGRVYFNHASTGPVSVKVKEIIQMLLETRSTSEMDEYEKFLQTSLNVKSEIGKMLNTTSDSIAFTDNTSNGLNVIANGISWKRCDQIILNDVEFPANVYPFLNLKRYGVEIEFVKSHNGVVTAEDIIEKISSQTRLISVSWVQFLSGYRIDLETLGKVCREKGIILCVDAIQGLGAIKLDVQKCSIDFLASGTQKWMLGLQGLAFIYVSESLQQKMIPHNVGWFSVKNAWNFLDYKLELRESADRFHTGTLNTFGIYAMQASFDLFNEFGWDLIEETVLDNTLYFFNELVKEDIHPVLNDYSSQNLSGIVTIKHDNAERIFKELSAQKIHLSLREGLLRFSPHFYNNRDDINRVILALKIVLQE